MARLNGLNKGFIALIKSLNAAIMQPHQKLYLRLDYLRLVTARGSDDDRVFICFGFFVYSSRGKFVFWFLACELIKKIREEKKFAENVEKIISSEKTL